MIRLLLFILLLGITSPQLHAQKKDSMKKRFKEAYASIKSGSGQENHERILLDSLKKNTIEQKTKAEAYHVCALLQQSINNGLNMNAYLKKNIDTVKLYKSILKIYDYTLRSDSLDVTRKYENKHIKMRQLHRNNLLNGGKFLLRKSQWTDAFSFFDMFLKTHTTDTDSLMGRVAYWATVCGMNEGNPRHVLMHVDQAISMANRVESSALSEYKARSVLHLGDTIQWIKLLDEGVDKYPGCNYFFLNMMEHYMREGQLSKGLARIDSLVRTDGDRAVYWFAMSMFALEQGEHEKCVRMSDECLKRDSTNIDAYYNKGISLLNMTLSEDDIKARRKLFQQALKPMEKVRELSPESIDRWGNPLYRIYLNLNMGKKFEEIDTLLEKHNNGVEQKETETIIHKVDETGNKRMDKQLGR